MKKYSKTIEAEQFNGDVESLKVFVGKENTISEEEDHLILQTSAEKWKIVPTDYVAKGYYGLLVFKEQRFLQEFTEVIEKDLEIPAVKEDKIIKEKKEAKK